MSPAADRPGRVLRDAFPGGTVVLRLAVWVALTGTVLVPLALVVSVGLGANHLPLLLEGGLVEASINSLVSALASAVVAVVAGTVLSLVVDRSDVRGRTWLRMLMLTPLLVPPFVGAIAWTGLLTRGGLVDQLTGWVPWQFYGGGGVIALLALHSMPTAYLVVSAALARVPDDLELAARMAGASPLRVYRDVTLPLVRPALLAAFTLVFVGNLGDFGIPVLVGVPAGYDTLATMVYRYLQSGTVSAPLQVVSQIGVVLVLLGLAGVLVDRLVARRSVELDGSGGIGAPLALGRLRPAVTTASWLIALVVTVGPLVALMSRALIPAPGVPLTWANLTLDNLSRSLSAPSTVQGFSNSLVLSLGAAALCGVLGLAVGLLVARLRGRGDQLALLAVLLPTAVPGLIVAVGWLILGRYTGLFNTRWIILGAYVTAFTALVTQAVRGPLAGMSGALEEAARLSGARWFRSVWDTSIRLALPAAAAGAMLVAVTAVRELTLSVLLVAPGTQTFGVVIFSYQQAGDYNASSALSLVFMLIGLAAIGLVVPRERRPAPSPASPQEGTR